MKHILLTTLAAVVLVGCGPSKNDLLLIEASESGNIEDVKESLVSGLDFRGNGFTTIK